MPSLHNTVWEKSELILDVPITDQLELSKAQQLSIRRSRIGVEILKRPSDDQTKFDLFQRLNAGGTQANAQELRNCIMLMVNGAYYRAVKAAAEQQVFQSVLGISEDQLERQRHMEYAVRFLVHAEIPYDGTLDVEEYIDEGVVRLAAGTDGSAAQSLIDRTFSLLDAVAGKNALRRFEDGSYKGKVSLVGLEAIAVGVAKNIDAIMAQPDPQTFIRERIEGFWKQPKVDTFTSLGLRGTTPLSRGPFLSNSASTMSRPFTDSEFSAQVTEDRAWRLREISDLKIAITRADFNLRRVLLRSLVTICYAHWEGYVRFAARKYLGHVALQKPRYDEIDRQFLRNYFLPRLAALSVSKRLEERCALVDEIISASDRRFSRVNEDLVNTKANLNFDVFGDICLVCSVSITLFLDKASFIDTFLLKRRNSIAHGEDTFIDIDDLDELTENTVSIMRRFGDALENHVHLRTYRSA